MLILASIQDAQYYTLAPSVKTIRHVATRQKGCGLTKANQRSRPSTFVSKKRTVRVIKKNRKNTGDARESPFRTPLSKTGVLKCKNRHLDELASLTAIQNARWQH